MLTLFPTHALQLSLALAGHQTNRASKLMENPQLNIHLPPTAPPSPIPSSRNDELLFSSQNLNNSSQPTYPFRGSSGLESAEKTALTSTAAVLPPHKTERPHIPAHYLSQSSNASTDSSKTAVASLPPAFLGLSGVNTPSEDLARGVIGTPAAAMFPSPKLEEEDGAVYLADGHSPIFTGSTTSQLRKVLDNIDVDFCEVNGENAFFIANLSEVYRQHVRWVKALPRVTPFYAVKCNPDPYVLRLLSALGCGFDCASNGEIQSVLDLGVSPKRIIYANPCKAASFVRQARLQQVSLTTFDNTDELTKMKRFHPDCKLVVRILTDDSKSVCQLGLKFGAPLDSVPRLLAKARALDLDVVGVSFHVGSGCYDAGAFADAISRARRAFEMGAEAGYEFSLLDVGGGYAHDNFDQIAGVLREAIDEQFPDSEFGPSNAARRHPLEIIAEPGRYYVQRAFVLATNIIARRDGRRSAEEEQEEEEEGKEGEEEEEQGVDQGQRGDQDVQDSAMEEATGAGGDDKPKVMYYQNDGVYASFNCILFDHAVVHPRVLTLQRQFVYDESLPAPGVPSALPCPLPPPPDKSDAAAGANPLELQPCSVWGPTCDSIDCVKELAYLPQGLEVGDWLVYSDMGGYTLCAASSFNGLRPSEVRYTFGGEDEAGAKEVQMLLTGAETTAAVL